MSKDQRVERESREPVERMRLRMVAVLALAVLGTGAVCFAWLLETRVVPERRAQVVGVPDVAVLTVEPREERVAVVGYGTVRPKHVIDIVPQVSGQITQVHPDLATGKIIPKGEVLFEVAAEVYEARVRQVEAEIRGLEATLARHDAEQASLDERITTVEEMVAIERSDYETSRDLYEQERVGTERDVDLVRQKYLRQKDVLTELKTRRDMVPHVRAETVARLEGAQAKLAQAKNDLEHTKILCPFKARVESVSAYRSQVVTAFFSIARLTDMEAFEINVGIDPRELRWLDPAVRPDSLTGGAEVDGPAVTVRWALHDHDYTWRGFVTRFERVDEVTRTARMVVEIREQDMGATESEGTGGQERRLSIGMYCRTELPGVALSEALLVPRHAVHEDRFVYVFEPAEDGSESGVLARREITPLRPLGDQVLVDYRGRASEEVCELRPGEMVVVSPLAKPVEGMRLRTRDTSVASVREWFRPRDQLVRFDPRGIGKVPLVSIGSAALSGVR